MLASKPSYTPLSASAYHPPKHFADAKFAYQPPPTSPRHARRKFFISHPNCRIITSTLLVLVLFLNLSYFYCVSTHHAAMTSADNPSTHLAVSLAQSAADPPTLTLRVKNTHSSSPLTLLTWDTPLDPMALQLGLLSITPSGSSEPLNLPTIKVSRLLPPPDDAFVTLAPGEAREQQIALKEPVVPLKKLKEEAGGKASVACKGAWRSVWHGPREGIEKSALESGKGSVSGEYECEAVQIQV